MLGQIQLRKEIAARLKHAREAGGYESIKHFAEQHRLAVKQYQKHEEGTLALRASQALRYCELLNISVYWLMLGENKNKKY